MKTVVNLLIFGSPPAIDTSIVEDVVERGVLIQSEQGVLLKSDSPVLIFPEWGVLEKSDPPVLITPEYSLMDAKANYQNFVKKRPVSSIVGLGEATG